MEGIEDVRSKATWFDEDIRYAGVGTLYLEGTDLCIDGPARAEVKANGELEIIIDIRGSESLDKYGPFGAIGLLYGWRELEDGTKQMSIGGEIRSLSYAILRADDGGVLKTTADPSVTTEDNLLLGRQTLIVRPDAAIYTPKNVGEPKYWVLPILNFLASWPPLLARSDTAALSHPLRVAKETDLPWGLDAEGDIALSPILYVPGGEPILLEKLRDFRYRKSDLENGKSGARITSLMIGEVEGRNLGLEDLPKWLPFQLLAYLGLATGLEAGAPWIEFRDKNRELALRIHKSFGNQEFVKTWEFLRPDIHGGLDEILRLAITQPAAVHPRVLVALRHALRSRANPLRLEERLTHVMQGLDGLFAYSLETTMGKVRRQFENCSRRGFGEKMICLADSFGLNDRAALQKIQEANPGLFERMNWQQWVSVKRNEIFHEGFLSYPSHLDYDKTFGLFFHLSDLLSRCILKILGYTGRYQPSTMPYYDNRWTVNWVTEQTTAEDLRYLANHL